MDFYLDANATTPVLPAARAAAQAAMATDFGNPSSVHSAGLRARALLDDTRALARRVLGVADGRLLFTSGATEGIQTAVLSALLALRDRAEPPGLLLYGATEHKAVPQALQHWQALLGLPMQILPIPVDADGRHYLAWLRTHAPRAGLVCTMAANNETGVVSDLDGIEAALADSPALWLVDGVQALGKLDLGLARRRIDYAPFSGHKLYAPKGIGLLYVRAGAPFTPLLAGGGQEAAQRGGTENMAGIAAFGAVLAALAAGHVFQPAAVLQQHRAQLVQALQDAFAGLVFNAPQALCLPTTLNFAVPGLSSRQLLEVFDAAGIRVSGGSACSAAQAEPSFVLQAMGLPAWQCASAVRLSFGPADDAGFIARACERLRACGQVLRDSCLVAGTPGTGRVADGVQRFMVDGACCYLLSDAASRRCVVIDPLPALTDTLAHRLQCQGLHLVAVLDTHSHGDQASAAAALRAAVPAAQQSTDAIDGLGWPLRADCLGLGHGQLQRLALPGHTRDSTAYLLRDGGGRLRLAFVGDMVMPGTLGRSDLAQSAPLAFAASLRRLAQAVGMHTVLLAAHDDLQQFASTLAAEGARQPLLAAALSGQLTDAGFASAKAALETGLGEAAWHTLACGAQPAAVALSLAGLRALLAAHPQALVVDVREACEQGLGGLPAGVLGVQPQALPLSCLANALPHWLAPAAQRPIVLVCRSGNRSRQAALALRRLGHGQAWSLSGGMALLAGPDRLAA